jgi:hypothetical protein
MVIDSSGDVGIGTTAPATLLHVYSTTAANTFLIEATSSSSYASMYFKNNTPASVYMGIGGSAVGGNFQSNFFIQSPNSIVLNTNGRDSNGTVGMIINTSGYVGIGTATPANLLTVSQLGANYSSPVLVIDAGIPGNTSAGAPRGIGRPLLGIGNSSWTGGGVAGDYYGIGFGYGGATSGTSGYYYPAEIGLYVQTTSGNTYGDLVFSTRPTTTATTIASERMRITSAGNVGIGTATPAAALQITQTSAAGSGYGSLLVDSPNSGSAGGCITIRNSAGGTNAFASLIFEVDGSTSCTSSSTPTGFAQGNGMIYCLCQGVGAGNAGKMGFIQWNGSAEVETMTLLPSGYVGIGTASPGYALHVNGTAYTNGLTTAGNNGFANYAAFPNASGVSFGWNKSSGTGETNFLNCGGLGVGGFSFYNCTSASQTLSLIATISSSGTYTASDATLKTNIIPIKTNRSLARILALQPVAYQWIDQPSTNNMIGLLAQSTQAVNPHCVTEVAYSSDPTEQIEDPLRPGVMVDKPIKKLAINYQDIILHLVGAIQEHEKTISTQEARMAAMEARLAAAGIM